MSFKEFQDGRHVEYQNGTNLAFLNLYVAPIPPIKYQLNPTPFRRCRLKTFKTAANLNIETERIEQFWISMSPQYLPSSISSIRLSVQEMSLKEFEDGRHLWYWNGTSLAILNFLVASIPPHQESAQSDFGRSLRLKHFKMVAMAAISSFGRQRF